MKIYVAHGLLVLVDVLRGALLTHEIQECEAEAYHVVSLSDTFISQRDHYIELREVLLASVIARSTQLTGKVLLDKL